ncbi:MAG TPA: methyltransferase [Clostridiales bacterium]|nr:methyltransferase [Clostridiales bacterium]
MNKNEFTDDDLILGGYRLLQKRDGYRFSLDALLLAAFVPVFPGAAVLDLGCGSGILPLLLLGREPSLAVTAVEKMEGPCALARRNMAKNKAPVTVLLGDAMEADRFLAAFSFDLIVTNPPFYPVAKCRLPQKQEIAAAKTELFWSPEGLMDQSFSLLRERGRLALIFPGTRKEEICARAAEAGLCLERSRDIFSKKTNPGFSRVLLQWIKAPCRQEKLPPLSIYTEDGDYTQEMKRIFEIYHGTGTVSCGDAHRQP